MPLTASQKRSFGIFFRDPPSACLIQDRPEKRVYTNDIFCPFFKIRLIWARFKTEPNLGSDWIRKRAIRV